MQSVQNPSSMTPSFIASPLFGFPLLVLTPRFWRAAGLALGLAGLSMGLSAAPLLTCQVSYAGTVHTVTARPVEDPYPVPSVDIGGRFWFKAVMVGQGQHIRRILLYTYLDASPHPVLVHQAKYLPPFQASPSGAARSPAQAMDLTGQHYLYAGPVERELIYSCTLEGVQP